MTPQTAWAAIKAPLPANAVPNTGPELNEVACPSATTCVAVGSYEAHPSGYGQGLLVTGSGSSWKATEGPLPADAATNAPAAQFYSVACPSITVCVAVGTYDATTGRSVTSQGMLLTGHGSSWTAIKAPLPPDAAADPSVSLAKVACPSATVCVAEGYYIDSSGIGRAMLLAGHGSSWTAARAPMPTGAAADPVIMGVNVVGCRSTTSCVVAGVYSDAPHSYQGLLWTGHGSSWTATKATVPGAGAHPDADLADVACPSTALCVVSGGYFDSSGPVGMLLTWHGSSWSAAKEPRAAIYQDVDLRGVDCPSVTKCVSVGYYSGSSGNNQGLLLTGSGSSWTVARAPLPAGGVTSQDAELSDVACASTTMCAAVGSYTGTSGSQPDVLLTNHGSWTAIKATLPAGGRLSPQTAPSDVACPSPTACVATGYYIDSSGHQQPLLLTGTA